jgi:hypothetical protein
MLFKYEVLSMLPEHVEHTHCNMLVPDKATHTNQGKVVYAYRH